MERFGLRLRVETVFAWVVVRRAEWDRQTQSDLEDIIRNNSACYDGPKLTI